MVGRAGPHPPREPAHAAHRAMRRYLLDTTPLAALLNNHPAAIVQLHGWLIAHELATSILVYGEVVESLSL